jgi:hypothetical protein
MNQCSGHGECILGFCMCHEGWYSHDCSRRKAGLEYTEGGWVGVGVAPVKPCNPTHNHTQGLFLMTLCCNPPDTHRHDILNPHQPVATAGAWLWAT